MATRDPSVGTPVEIPEDVHQRVSALCLALPEVTTRVDESRVRARSTAWSYDIRRRSFCLRDTDWGEIRELVTESYHLLAPKKLAAPLD